MEVNCQKTFSIGNIENTISLRRMSGTLKRDLWGASCSIWGLPDTKHKLVITHCPLRLFHKTRLTGFFHLCPGFWSVFFDILCKECFRSCMCNRLVINKVLWKEHLTPVSTVNLLLIRWASTQHGN